MQDNKILVGILAISLMPGLVFTATLEDIPMQGGMVMPMVSYNSGENKMSVWMPLEIPQLTPLLLSNPTDNFDAADPWFGALDPSRRGESFSRRYGFVMDAMTDPLPIGTQMWIRKLSGPADLRFYRYSTSAPKTMTPIFGTDGTTNALYWNGVMFHPVVSAPPGTNGFVANFEIYLNDVATGEEIPGSSSGMITFNWTNLSDGRPTLTFAPKGMITWPLNTSTNWLLECANSFGATNWTIITNEPALVAGQPCVIVDTSAKQLFFRMRFHP